MSYKTAYTFKEILRILIISLFFLFIVTYGFLRSSAVIFGVKIKEINIENGRTYTENILPITGNAKNAIHLTINGREIYIDKEGNFAEDIALLSGYNIIEIYARDKFGKEDVKNYQLIYQKVPSLEDSVVEELEIEQTIEEEKLEESTEENLDQEILQEENLEENI
jgi:hypothetical protein